MMKIEGHDTEIVHFFALSLDKQKEYAEKTFADNFCRAEYVEHYSRRGSRQKLHRNDAR